MLINEVLLNNLDLYDQAIELAKEFARQNTGRLISLELFRNFLTAQHFPLCDNEPLAQALFTIAVELKYFIDNERDTIWAFILKNIYKPLFFKCKFDFIIGNPPWIAFRYIEPAYQAFLKRQITEEYKLLTSRGELITHLEIATLFLVRAADLYLKTGGTIAFVLPKSLFSSDQHDGLRKYTFKFSEDTLKNLFWREVWDCEKVSPLFNVPTCVLIADKGETAKKNYPIIEQILRGELERKNASLDEAENTLTVEDVEFSLHTRGKRSFWATGKGLKAQSESYYKTRFAQGATIVPRSFWFVQITPSPIGFNPNLLPLETAERALQEAKNAYKSVFFKDTVESRFIYATLLSTDLLPFGHLDYRLVVLPIELQVDHYKLIDANEARKQGFLHLARWLENAEKEWTNRRRAKAKRKSVYERLDYVHGLTRQSPQAKYRVIYNTSGTFLTAAVVKNQPIEFKIEGQKIAACGFVTDHKTYFCELQDLQEAFFLASVLNAPVTDQLIKPMQSRGLWGPRDIHKKALELPIPQFDIADVTHKKLAELGMVCSAKVGQWLKSGCSGKITSIGKLRGMVREMLNKELSEIDELVKRILI